MHGSLTLNLSSRRVAGKTPRSSGCILGGCSIYGGKGSVHGSIIGIVFIITLQGALRALGISSNYQTVLVGVVLIIAVLGDTLRYRKLRALKS